MFFKLVGALSFLLVTTSCTLPLNEAPTPRTDPNAGSLGESTRCLADVLPTMQGFMDGSADPRKVSETWSCFRDGLSLFQKKVRGEKFPDRFTAREIAKFFEDFFLDTDVKINDVLLTEIFKLKRIFVGGDRETISREELEKLKQFAERIRLLSLDVLPYMKVFSLNWLPERRQIKQEDLDFFELANQALQEAAKEISAIIGANNQDYRISDFAVLIKELSFLYRERWELVEDVERAMPLILKLKLTLAGGLEEVIQAQEWRRFALISARAFVQYLRYYYFLKDADAFGSAPEIQFFFRSVDDLFSYFGDMVREKPGGKFTKTELVQVAQSLASFFPGVQVTEELITQAMKVKTLIFGGSEDLFTPSEFDYARTKVESFRSISTRVVSFAEVYGLSWNPSAVTEEEQKNIFHQAKTNLKQVALDLSAQFDTNYDLNNLILLANEVDKLKLERGGVRKEWKKLAQKYVPLLVAGKNIISSDDSSIILRSQWPRILDWVAQVYSQFNYYYYFVSPISIFGGKGLNEFVYFSRSSIDLLKSLMATKPNSQIPFVELNKFNAALVGSEILSKKIKLSSLDKLTEAVLKKWLTSPLDRLAGKVPSGVTLQGLSVLSNELDYWVDLEKVIDEYVSRNTGTIGVSHARFREFWVDFENSKLANEFVIIFDSFIPMTFNNQITGRDDQDSVRSDRDRLYLSYSEGRYDLRNAGFLNVFRAAYRMLLRSYSKDINRINFYSGLNLAEMREFFSDVKPFFSDLEMLDPRNDSFVDKRYRDGSLFTSAGDGDDSFLNFKEGFDLALMLFSGISIDDELSEKLKQNCPMTPATFKQDRLVEIACLQDVYWTTYDSAFTQLPDLVKHWKNLSRKDFSEMAINLLKAAGYTPDGTTKIKMGDASLFPFVVQYLETAFQRFDRGANGGDNLIDTQEAIAAFPVFQKMLGRVANVSDELLLAAFTFILERNKIPNAVELLIWNKNKPKWKLAVDRKKLAKVFGILADQLGDKPAN